MRLFPYSLPPPTARILPESGRSVVTLESVTHVAGSGSPAGRKQRLHVGLSKLVSVVGIMFIFAMTIKSIACLTV